MSVCLCSMSRPPPHLTLSSHASCYLLHKEVLSGSRLYIDDSHAVELQERTVCGFVSATACFCRDMAATQPSSGAAASTKAEKANRESLAKKKSALKAELERTAAELEEIEQLKAEAEDLEDEEMLSEMQAEEQRLQVWLPSKCSHPGHYQS